MEAKLLGTYAAADSEAANIDVPAAGRRVVDELLRRYGLGAALHVTVAPGGMLNQNLIATSARGAYFLKGYRYADSAPIAREHRLISFAAQAGIPTPPPISTPDGATFMRVGGRFWAVFPFLRGEQPSPNDMTPIHAASMGRVLAHIHEALSRFPANEAVAFPTELTWDSSQASKEMQEYEAEIARRPIREPFDQHALSSFAYRRTLLASGIAGPQAFALLPVQLLHGDFHDRNLFFDQGGQVTGIIDWELAKVGPRAWEIVRTLDYALPLAQDLEGGGALLRAFIHAYAQAAPLTEEECVAMPELYWAVRVHSLWPYEEHYRKGSARTDRVALQDLETLGWWAAHRHELADALKEALASAPDLRLTD